MKLISWKWLILAILLLFYKDDSRILLVSYFFLPDLKVADIGSTNENAPSPDGTAYNLGIKKQHQILISSPLR